MDNAIEISGLYKVISNNTILSNINLQCEYNRIYGFVGRNGSGKSMLFRSICGLVTPTQGTITVNSKLITKEQLAENVGVIIENPGFIPDYNGFKNLKLLASINNIIGDDKIKESIKRVGLDPEEKKKVKNYSLGMKQRLGIAQAIMEDPKVIILDEPFNGLDSYGIKDIRELLLELKNNGKCILITSHNNEDIDLLCDEVFNIENGEIKKYFNKVVY